MKRLFKAGLVIVLMSFGLSAWADGGCPGFGQRDNDGHCYYPDGSSGSHPMGAGGSGYNDNGSNSAPPQVIYRKLPDSWGAVAIDPNSNYGYSSKQASKQASIQAALNDCGTSSCKIVLTYSNACVVSVGGYIGKSTYFPTFARASLVEARSKALRACNAKAKNCQILVSECSLPS